MPINPRLFPRWGLAFLVILLLVLGAPSLLARLIALGADPVHEALLKGDAVTQEDLSLLDASRTRLLPFFSNNEYLNDHVLVAMTRAVQGKVPANDPLYARAQEAQREALAASPADPFGWYRLAYLFYVAEGPSSHVAAAWQQSINAAPFEPSLMLSRLQMAMSLGDLIDPSMRSFIAAHVRYVWHDDPDRLAGLAYRGSYVSVAQDALRDEPAELASFQQKIADMAKWAK